MPRTSSGWRSPIETIWESISTRLRVAEEGQEYWSYSFVREVAEQDIVLHYRARPRKAITHWSRAVGDPYRDQVYWGAHGMASGRGPLDPYWRPGWRRPLDGPYAFQEPVTLAQLRAVEASIREIRHQLRDAHTCTPLYFPFLLSGSRPLRPFQGYLTKFPAALVQAIPQLAEIAELAATSRPSPTEPAPNAAKPALGTDYRAADPDARSARRQPFSVDPDLVDRALASHARVQEALAAAVRKAGFLPRSSAPGEPVFDVAWEDGGAIVVAEIKSLTMRNEEKQLRLALGQVLRYSHLLSSKGRPVRRVIAVEREPSDGSWSELCVATGVELVWPATFAALFG
jgi:hypothetical protein